MKGWDKGVMGILVLMAISLFFYGFKTSTGYAIAVGDAATSVGGIGKGFWLGLLGIFVVALVFVRLRRKG